jgi:ATP-dependent Clp protease protease subunit
MWNDKQTQLNFEYGIDIQRRRVFLYGPIDEVMAENVVKGLTFMQSMNPDRKITIFVSSEGGCIYSMFEMYDAIRRCKCIIETVASGKCMSAAPLIVAAGDDGNRFATPNCSFMLHDGWDDIGALRRAELDILSKHMDDLRYRWADCMAEHTNQDRRFWLQITNKNADSYFDAQQALEYSIVDKIYE